MPVISYLHAHSPSFCLYHHLCPSPSVIHLFFIPILYSNVIFLICVIFLIFYISVFRLFCLSYIYQYFMPAFSSSLFLFFRSSHAFGLFSLTRNFLHVVRVITWIRDSIPFFHFSSSIEVHNEYVLSGNVNIVRPCEWLFLLWHTELFRINFTCYNFCWITCDFHQIKTRIGHADNSSGDPVSCNPKIFGGRWKE